MWQGSLLPSNIRVKRVENAFLTFQSNISGDKAALMYVVEISKRAHIRILRRILLWTNELVRGLLSSHDNHVGLSSAKNLGPRPRARP